MRLFLDLIENLNQSKVEKDNVQALSYYFSNESPKEGIATLALLSQKKPARIAKTNELKTWLLFEKSIPEWLYEDCEKATNDPLETLGLLASGKKEKGGTPIQISDLLGYVQEIKSIEKEDQRDSIVQIWSKLDFKECHFFNKLITGSFRTSIPISVLAKSLALAFDQDEFNIQNKLKSNWKPDGKTLTDWLKEESPEGESKKPYPFHDFTRLEIVDEISNPEHWLVEWKYEGLRCQIMVMESKVWLWTLDHEMVSGQFPEIVQSAEKLPHGTVLEGQILPLTDGKVASSDILKARLRSKKPGKKELGSSEFYFLVFDQLESRTEDIRHLPLQARKAIIESTLSETRIDRFFIEKTMGFSTLLELEEIQNQARENHASGLMLKKSTASYTHDKDNKNWLAMALKPITLNAVLLYAKKGKETQSNKFDNFTLAAWDEGKLVPFVNLSMAFSTPDQHKIGSFIKLNTVENFGPVRSLKPGLVFEISFDSIETSARHKSGIILKKAKLVQIRWDLKIEEAIHLRELKAMTVKG